MSILSEATRSQQVRSGAAHQQSFFIKKGDQEKDNHTTNKDSPRVATVKTLFAMAATNKWKVKTVDVTAAFLHGKKMERKVYVSPPAEYREDDKVWQL